MLVRLAGIWAEQSDGGDQPSFSLRQRRRLIQYDEDAIDDQYIVFFRDEVIADQKMESLKESRSIDSSFTLLHTYSTVLNGATISNVSRSALDDLLMDEDVDFIEQDRPVYLAENHHFVDRKLVDSSVQFMEDEEPWGLDRLDSPLSMDGEYHYSYTGDGVFAYIFDTGIRFDHPEFIGRVRCSLNLMFQEEDCNDYHGHGTHVAGVIGGSTYGVAKDVQLRAIKTLDRHGVGQASAVIAGLEYVQLQKGIDITNTPTIVNLSLGSSVSIAFNTAVENAVNNDIIVVIAGGNGGIDACSTSPASAGKGIAVGAVTQTSTKTNLSNFGQCIDIFAYVMC